MDIIIDRKKKRFYHGMDSDWKDATGVETARAEKARTIDIPNESRNPVHNYIREWGHKAMLGKKVFALNDRKEIISGFVVDIIPPYYLSLRNKGVVRFEDCISMEA